MPFLFLVLPPGVLKSRNRLATAIDIGTLFFLFFGFYNQFFRILKQVKFEDLDNNGTLIISKKVKRE